MRKSNYNFICGNEDGTKKFFLDKMIGQGAFGSVHICESLSSGNNYACKLIDKEQIRKENHRKKIKSEIKIHSSIKHKNIVNFKTCFEDKKNIYIILELCTNGSLMRLIKYRKKLNEYETRYIIYGILNGLNYLHNKKYIIHRDLKLGNVLLDKNMTIKICDFGLAAQLKDKSDLKNTMCGTPNYIAPEIIKRKSRGHSFKADIWSVGVIIYTLLFGKPPFESQDLKATYKNIKTLNYTLPKIDEFNSQIVYQESIDAFRLIKSILVLNVNKRPTVEQILKTPFMALYEIPETIPKSIFYKPLDNPKKRIKLISPFGKMNKRRVNNMVTVLKWVDHSEKYGLAYILSNNCVGIYFIDNTSILSTPKNQIFYYIEHFKTTEKIAEFSANDIYEKHQKKVKIFRCFKEYFQKKKK